MGAGPSAVSGGPAPLERATLGPTELRLSRLRDPRRAELRAAAAAINAATVESQAGPGAEGDTPDSSSSQCSVCVLQRNSAAVWVVPAPGYRRSPHWVYQHLNQLHHHLSLPPSSLNAEHCTLPDSATTQSLPLQSLSFVSLPSPLPPMSAFSPVAFLIIGAVCWWFSQLAPTVSGQSLSPGTSVYSGECGGGFYNLSAINGVGDLQFNTLGNPSVAVQYFSLRPCGQVATSACGGAVNASICQSTQSDVSNVLSYYTAASTSVQWVYNGQGSLSELTADGAYCPAVSALRASNVTYICDLNATTPLITSESEATTCNYTFIIATTAVCGLPLTHSTTASSSSASPSTSTPHSTTGSSTPSTSRTVASSSASSVPAQSPSMASSISCSYGVQVSVYGSRCAVFGQVVFDSVTDAVTNITAQGIGASPNAPTLTGINVTLSTSGEVVVGYPPVLSAVFTNPSAGDVTCTVLYVSSLGYYEGIASIDPMLVSIASIYLTSCSSSAVLSTTPSSSSPAFSSSLSAAVSSRSSTTSLSSPSSPSSSSAVASLSMSSTSSSPSAQCIPAYSLVPIEQSTSFFPLPTAAGVVWGDNVTVLAGVAYTLSLTLSWSDGGGHPDSTGTCSCTFGFVNQSRESCGTLTSVDPFTGQVSGSVSFTGTVQYNSSTIPYAGVQFGIQVSCTYSYDGSGWQTWSITDALIIAPPLPNGPICGTSTPPIILPSSSSTASPPAPAPSSASAISSSPLSTSSASTGPAAAYSDPRFVGFYGQSFYVSGVAGRVYNLLSDSSVTMNAYFVQLERIRCPQVNGLPMTHCFDHSGTYFGVLGIATRDGDHLRITAGDVDEGFHSLTLNDLSLLPAHLASSASSSPPLSSSISVRVLSPRTVMVSVGLYGMLIDNVDLYVDVTEVTVSSWDRLVNEVRPDGLIGHTWNCSVSTVHDGDDVERFREREDNIMGCNTDRNRFCHRQRIE